MPGTESTVETLPVGRRVAYWRNRRGLTQQVFADRLGKSKSWVDKVERGARALDRFSVLREIAVALGIDVGCLVDAAPAQGAGPAGAERSEASGVRAALERYVSVTGHLDGVLRPPDLPELGKAVNHAWLAYQHGGYRSLSRTLPTLLHDAQSADAHHARDPYARRAAHLLAQAYQIASSVLRKLGEHELAWLAADRAMAVSIRAEDPLLTGIAAGRTGNALLALDRPRAALEAQLTVANRLAPGGAEPAHPDRLSVYGTLLLQGAMAAARLGDEATTRELLREAGSAAAAVGPDQNHYWTSFGPTNLQLHRTAADVELGEGRRAVDTHLRIEPGAFDALMPERRAHQLLDVARAYAQLGDPAMAGQLLLAGERLAPAEILDRPVAHRVVADIVRRGRGVPASITDLAYRMGLQSM